MRLARALLPACLVAVVAACGPVFTPADAGPPDGARLTASAAVTPGRPVTPASYHSPSVVTKPGDPLTLYAGAVELGSRQCVFFRSHDGGRTWAQPGGRPSARSHPFCTHTEPFAAMTVLALGRDDAIYFAHLGWSHQDQGQGATTSVFVARSTDEGDSWEVVAVHDARAARTAMGEMNYLSDLVVDARSGADDMVYASWTAKYPDSTPAEPSIPFMAVSTDSARTFSQPINLIGSFFDDAANITGDVPPALKRREHFGGENPGLTLDDQGNVFAAWARTSVALEPAPPHPRYLSRSPDGGKTLAVGQLAPASHLVGPGPRLGWSPDGGRDGTVHAVYEDRLFPEQGDRDVIYRRSLDSGATWSGPKVVNDDDSRELHVQVLPSLDVAPDGRLDVAWWDQRDAGGRYAVDVYRASSNDAGATWSANQRVTERPVDRTTGTWVDQHGDTRQPPALASTSPVVHLVWDAPAIEEPTSGRQVLRVTSAQFAEVVRPGPPRRDPYIVSVAVGAAVGILAGSRIRRRRR